MTELIPEVPRYTRIARCTSVKLCLDSAPNSFFCHSLCTNKNKLFQVPKRHIIYSSTIDTARTVLDKCLDKNLLLNVNFSREVRSLSWFARFENARHLFSTSVGISRVGNIFVCLFRVPLQKTQVIAKTAHGSHWTCGCFVWLKTIDEGQFKVGLLHRKNN